jgi:hypothetical protein
MGVTEHLHSPFALTPGEGPPVAIGYAGGPENGLDAKRTIPARNRTPVVQIVANRMDGSWVI